MEDSIITAVYKREPLWNPSHKLHKNVPVLKKLWKEVAQEVNKDEKTVRTRWKNLRTYFFRELRKIDKPNRGDLAKESICSWQFFKQMMFLKDKPSEGEQHSNCRKESDLSSGAEESQDETTNVPSPNSCSNSTITEQNTRPKKKIKTMPITTAQRDEQILELERKKIEILEKESAKESDDDLLFFQSLLPFIKTIPLKHKLKLRSKIQNLIIQEMDAIENFNAVQQNIKAESP